MGRRIPSNEDYQPGDSHKESHKRSEAPLPTSRQRFQDPDFAEQREDYPQESDR
jgi:hypothetical protein